AVNHSSLRRRILKGPISTAVLIGVWFGNTPLEEARAAVVAESSTGIWTTVWTDGLTSLVREHATRIFYNSRY
ncbi:hypothetical protein ZWY2020_008175, partial [Hordeum vulgare]